MRRTGPLLVLGLSLGVGVALLARGVETHAEPVSYGRVAVVDIADVIESAPGRRVIDANNRAAAETLKAYKQAQEDKLRQLDGQIQLQPKSHPDRKKLLEQFARTNAESEFELKWRASQADAAYADALEGLYGQIRGTIAQIAREGQYTLVLAKADERLDLTGPRDFGPQVVVRQVLYADQGLDITKLVKDRLAAGSTPPPAPAAGTPRPPTPAPAPAPVPPTPAPAPAPGPLPPPSNPGMR